VLAWDRRNRIPLWVAQHLSAPSLAAAKAAAEARKLKRHSNFTEDSTIPEIFRSKLSDYKGSGYDRGHMIPAADAKLTDESYNATFILTNIAPQVRLQNLNSEPRCFLHASPGAAAPLVTSPAGWKRLQPGLLGETGEDVQACHVTVTLRIHRVIMLHFFTAVTL
jgi:hypothetical protein